MRFVSAVFILFQSNDNWNRPPIISIAFLYKIQFSLWDNVGDSPVVPTMTSPSLPLAKDNRLKVLTYQNQVFPFSSKGVAIAVIILAFINSLQTPSLFMIIFLGLLSFHLAPCCCSSQQFELNPKSAPFNQIIWYQSTILISIFNISIFSNFYRTNVSFLPSASSGVGYLFG